MCLPHIIEPMLSIKLQRVGKKHQPNFRIVVAEKRSKLGGPPVENLGTYNPFTKNVNVDKERAGYWLKTGAISTITVHNLFVKAGVVSSSKLKLKMKKKAVSAEAATTTTPDTVQATEAQPSAEQPPAETAEASVAQ